MLMSYHGHASRGHGVGSIDVGSRAFADPFLANGSLEASKILLAMAHAVPVERLSVMTSELKKRGIDPNDVATQMRSQLAAGKSRDQAAFDAMRIALADDARVQAVSTMRDQAASKFGWDALVDNATLGDADAEQAGCIAAGTSTALAPIIGAIPIVGGFAQPILTIGGNVAGGLLQCSAGAQAAAAQAATAQAQAAAAQAASAQAAAAAQAQHRQTQIRTATIGGGIFLSILAVGWLLD